METGLNGVAQAALAAAPGLGALLFAWACVAGAAVLRGVTGFGFALAAVPLLSLRLAPAQAVGLVILLQVMVGLRDTVGLRGAVDRPSVARLSLGALIGTPLGVGLLAWLDPAAMRLAIAAVVAAGLLLLLRAPRGAVPGGLREAFPAGALAGLFGGLAAMAGPPAVVYYLRSGLGPAATRASLMVFFFVTSLIALPGLLWAGLLSGETLVLSALSLPVLLAGTALGGRLFRGLSEAAYRRLALITLALMALAAALRGLAGLTGAG